MRKNRKISRTRRRAAPYINWDHNTHAWRKFAAEMVKELDQQIAEERRAMAKQPAGYSEQVSHHLTGKDRVVVKYLLRRGFQQKRIAALFDVNQGRIAEINTEFRKEQRAKQRKRR